MHYEHYCHSQHPKCQPGLPATPINDKKQASEPRRKPTEEELDEISILSHEDEDGARSGFRNRLQGLIGSFFGIRMSLSMKENMSICVRSRSERILQTEARVRGPRAKVTAGRI
jgi:hypothetical protein